MTETFTPAISMSEAEQFAAAIQKITPSPVPRLPALHDKGYSFELILNTRDTNIKLSFEAGKPLVRHLVKLFKNHPGQHDLTNEELAKLERYR